MTTAIETLYAYYPARHDSDLITDLWPTVTVEKAMAEHTNQALDEVLTRLFKAMSEGKYTEADFNALLLKTINDIKNEIR